MFNSSDAVTNTSKHYPKMLLSAQVCCASHISCLFWQPWLCGIPATTMPKIWNRLGTNLDCSGYFSVFIRSLKSCNFWSTSEIRFEFHLIADKKTQFCWLPRVLCTSNVLRNILQVSHDLSLRRWFVSKIFLEVEAPGPCPWRNVAKGKLQLPQRRLPRMWSK